MSNSGPAVPEGPMTYNQVVLLGDSLFQQSTQILDGFCFQGALQDRKSRVSCRPPLGRFAGSTEPFQIASAGWTW